MAWHRERKRVRIDEIIGHSAEWVAHNMGSAQFIFGLTVFVAAWFVINSVYEFDPMFFVLNLLFSVMSSYAAPLIMLAQNRSNARDTIQQENDRAVNLQSASDMAYLTSQIMQLRTALSELPRRSDTREDVATLKDRLRNSTELHRRLQARRNQ